MATILAVALPVLAGAAGLAIDYGNLTTTHTKLQNAVDAAVMAGGLQLPFDPDVNNGKVSQAVKDLMKQNAPKAVLGPVTSGGQVRSVCITASQEVDMTLMNAVGIANKTITASACAGYNNIEVALVVDTTGSMSGSPIANVKSAALDLINFVMPAGGAAASKVGIVPFQGKVRITDRADGLAPGCRNADGTLNDGKLLAVWKDSRYRNPPNSSLDVSSDTCTGQSPIQALTSNRNTIVSVINNLNAGVVTSGTIIAEGIKWAKNVLTPGAPYTQGSSDPKYRKIMIVLTDGDNEDGTCGGTYGTTRTPNNYWTNAYYGMGLSSKYPTPSSYPHCENNGGLDQAMLSEATLAKQANIEIFSIRYGDSDSNDISLMKQIASSKSGTTDHYFDAPSESDFKNIFKLIGQQMGLRLMSKSEATGSSN